MGIEIERKFLLKNDSWRTLIESRILYRQAYIRNLNGLTTRVRICGNNAFLTLKGPSHGIARTEYEYGIPLADANDLIDVYCDKPAIEKYRCLIHASDSGLWEIDEFLGDNRGLVLAEIELPGEDVPFAIPDWIGREVSGIARYCNSMLAVHPYKDWMPEERDLSDTVYKNG